jgi:hypothetical protein
MKRAAVYQVNVFQRHACVHTVAAVERSCGCGFAACALPGRHTCLSRAANPAVPSTCSSSRPGVATSKSTRPP